MIVKINAPRDNGKRIRLFFPVPLWLARMKFIWKFVPPEGRQYAEMAPEMIRALQDYKRMYGPWNLVEVDSKDAHVLIRI